jgi:MFS transporter, FSR family, fosmidomycin resistance protein
MYNPSCFHFYKNLVIMDVELNMEHTDFHAETVATIAASHALHDTYQSFLPPLLPIIIEKLSLTNTSASFLSICLQAPSVLQPYFGYLADLYNLRWVMILSPAVTAAAMSLVGMAPTYGMIVLLALVTGISSAAFHSVAPVVLGNLSGSKLGRGMSFWMVGGEAGRALGPVVVVGGLAYLTLPGLPWLMAAGFAASIVLYFRLRDVQVHFHYDGEKPHWRDALRSMGPLMAVIAVLMLVRGTLVVGISTFLPTFLTGEGSSLSLAGIFLSIMQAAGVVGALFGGSLSDRWGRRRMLLAAMVSAPIFLLLFLNTSGLARLPFLMAVGLTSLSIMPVLMAVTQESFPESRALANGMFMLAAFGMNAVGTFLTGVLGDAFGLRTAFAISAFLMLAGIPMIFLLPKK